MNSEWQICSRCDPSDNEWPLECFTYAGNAYSKKKGRVWICNDCWSKVYVRVNTRCDWCGRFGSAWRKLENAADPFRHRRCKGPHFEAIQTFDQSLAL